VREMQSARMKRVITVFPNDMDITDIIGDRPKPKGGVKFFRKTCRIPVSLFVVIVKAGQSARLKTISGEYYAAISGCCLLPGQL
jgi:hypothetical protein